MLSEATSSKATAIVAIEVSSGLLCQNGAQEQLPCSTARLPPATDFQRRYCRRLLLSERTFLYSSDFLSNPNLLDLPSATSLLCSLHKITTIPPSRSPFNIFKHQHRWTMFLLDIFIIIMCKLLMALLASNPESLEKEKPLVGPEEYAQPHFTVTNDLTLTATAA